MKDPRNTSDTDTVAITTEAQLARYDSMILSVPEAEDDDGTGLVLQVLNATSWEDLNISDSLPSFKDLAGQEFQVLSLTRRQGDEQYGSGWYLVAECYDTRKGVEFRAQTSAGVAMAQLVALHNLNALPAIVRVETKQTKSNQTALNLRIVAANGGRA